MALIKCRNKRQEAERIITILKGCSHESGWSYVIREGASITYKCKVCDKIETHNMVQLIEK